MNKPFWESIFLICLGGGVLAFKGCDGDYGVKKATEYHLIKEDSRFSKNQAAENEFKEKLKQVTSKPQNATWEDIKWLLANTEHATEVTQIKEFFNEEQLRKMPQQGLIWGARFPHKVLRNRHFSLIEKKDLMHQLSGYSNYIPTCLGLDICLEELTPKSYRINVEGLSDRGPEEYKDAPNWPEIDEVVDVLEAVIDAGLLARGTFFHNGSDFFGWKAPAYKKDKCAKILEKLLEKPKYRELLYIQNTKGYFPWECTQTVEIVDVLFKAIKEDIGWGKDKIIPSNATINVEIHENREYQGAKKDPSEWIGAIELMAHDVTHEEVEFQARVQDFLKEKLPTHEYGCHSDIALRQKAVQDSALNVLNWIIWKEGDPKGGLRIDPKTLNGRKALI